MGVVDEEALAILTRANVAAFVGVDSYADVRCIYCGRGFDGSTMDAMRADGPVALAGVPGATPVACKACFEKRHRGI